MLQKINDEPARTCPECGQDSLLKLVSAAAFKLKGTGWYETDFKNKTPKKDKKNTNEDKTDNKKTNDSNTKITDSTTKSDTKKESSKSNSNAN
tara:strand:+ start:314 stop:592 length:279 start_codon:yes stop_codon:yes gene_type:complete